MYEYVYDGSSGFTYRFAADLRFFLARTRLRYAVRFAIMSKEILKFYSLVDVSYANCDYRRVDKVGNRWRKWGALAGSFVRRRLYFRVDEFYYRVIILCFQIGISDSWHSNLSSEDERVSITCKHVERIRRSWRILEIDNTSMTDERIFDVL